MDIEFDPPSKNADDAHISRAFKGRNVTNF